MAAAAAASGSGEQLIRGGGRQSTMFSSVVCFKLTTRLSFRRAAAPRRVGTASPLTESTSRLPERCAALSTSTRTHAHTHFYGTTNRRIACFSWNSKTGGWSETVFSAAKRQKEQVFELVRHCAAALPPGPMIVPDSRQRSG